MREGWTLTWGTLRITATKRDNGPKRLTIRNGQGECPAALCAQGGY